MIKIKLIFLCCIAFFLSCNQTIGMDTSTTNVVAGTSKITGKIIIPDDIRENDIQVKFKIPLLISGQYSTYDCLVDQSGEFSLDFDVETDTTFVLLYTDLNFNKVFMVEAVNGGVTNLDITYDSQLDVKNVEVNPSLSKPEITRIVDVLNKMMSYNKSFIPLYDKSLDEFLDYTKSVVSEKSEIIVDKDSLLSKEVKRIISEEYRLYHYLYSVFEYEDYMKNNYRNTTSDTVGKPTIQKIERTYFSFLKDFNFNDPHVQQRFAFPEMQKTILQNEVLGLPPIGESDIPSWLARVKVILADLVGFEDGLYYDILAANAYSQQLNEQVKPLTEKQKAHITHYWKEGEIAKILFRNNEQVVELDKVKSPVVVNDVSTVAQDKIIENIVSKYKGKVIFIDLWATWCGPCLEAMNQFSDTKGQFKDKNVVFVYITNGSSPQKLWEAKIQGIGNDHYYLSKDQWYYMMNHFGFEAIPSYVLYSKEGTLVKKFTGFPGNEKVKEMIDGLLK